MCAFILSISMFTATILWPPSGIIMFAWRFEGSTYISCIGLTVVIHRLFIQGGMDETVMEALESKGDVQDTLLAALKARITQLKKRG